MSVRQRLSPALEGVGEGDPLDVDGGPVAFGDDLVSDAGGGKDGREVVEGSPEVVAHLVDVVPLVAGRGDGHVVGIKLEPVELPLEDEQRSWKVKEENVKMDKKYGVIFKNIL